jgi:micrococcal nuclease
MYEYWAHVTKVVDGDTLDLSLDLGFGVSFKIRARLAFIDTPEKYGVKTGSPEWEKGVAATEFVKAWLAQRKDTIVVRSHDGSKVEQGKYGRWLVEVCDREGTLNETLVKAGHAERVNY